MNNTELKKLLLEHDIHPNTNLDQHFLIDDSVLDREIEAAGITELDTVLEVGAGPGVLTRKIAEKTGPGKFTVIEIDQKFQEILEEIPNTNVVIGDALKVDFPEFNKFLSNVPYSISSPLIFKILENDFEVAILCLQKEFADRMVAQPGEKDYSRLSVNCAVRANIEMIETVSKGKFYPQPLVDSAVVRLTPKIDVNLPESFDSIVRALFNRKNKMVRATLKDASHFLGETENVKGFVKTLDTEIAEKRVINLTPDEIIELAKNYDNF